MDRLYQVVARRRHQIPEIGDGPDDGELLHRFHAEFHFINRVDQIKTLLHHLKSGCPDQFLETVDGEPRLLNG